MKASVKLSIDGENMLVLGKELQGSIETAGKRIAAIACAIVEVIDSISTAVGALADVEKKFIGLKGRLAIVSKEVLDIGEGFSLETDQSQSDKAAGRTISPTVETKNREAGS